MQRSRTEPAHLAEEDITTTWPGPRPESERRAITLITGSRLRSLLRELLDTTAEGDAPTPGGLKAGDIITTWIGR